MNHAPLIELAARQFNRFSREQLLALGYSDKAIEHNVTGGQFARIHEGVFGIAPVLDDDWGRWKGATLTAPETAVSHMSAGAAFGFWSWPRRLETVTRPGNGGPRELDGIRVYRSSILAADLTELRGIPVTSVERVLLDLARMVSTRTLARCVREAVRLELTTIVATAEILGRYPKRPGTRHLAATLARYSGLPLARARSGAEVRALEILRNARRPMPALNVRIAGEEADLSWPRRKLIVEIDGGPFHLDLGEDQRKQATWEAAGWRVQRLPSDDVYENPGRLLELAPTHERP